MVFSFKEEASTPPDMEKHAEEAYERWMPVMSRIEFPVSIDHIRTCPYMHTHA